MTFLTDRSRIVTNKCPRARYLQYHSQNTGIVSSKLIISLSTGIAVHNGVAVILKTGDIEQAVSIAIAEYTEEVHKKQLDIEQNENQLFVFNEQKALIEALIRIYFHIQYPKLLSEYEVLEVEKEILYTLVPSNHKVTYDGDIGHTILNKYDGITLMSKPDAILRDKSTNSLVVYSLKTSSSWTETNEKSAKYDDQGISELIAVESIYNGEVEAIKMDYLIKGQRSWVKDSESLLGSKKKIQSSFLVHPYMYDGGFTTTYSLKYTRAKGWKRVNIWEEISIKEWVDFLINDHYEYLTGEAEDSNSKIIVSPACYIREPEDIENWKEQVIEQEIRIERNLNEIRKYSPNLVGPRELDKEHRTRLNRYFKQERSECYNYGRYCYYVDVCWEGLTTKDEKFMAREPHHDLEREVFVQLYSDINK